MLSSKDEKSPKGFFLAKSTGSAEGAVAAGAWVALTDTSSAGLVALDFEEVLTLTELFLTACFGATLEAFLVLLTLV